MASLSAGCGGGASTRIQPPPQADFTLNISPSSVTINQGATSSAIQVSVQPTNGFSGAVEVSLSGLPAGVVANPASPFTVQSGSGTVLLLGASTTATAGNVSITATGTSGSLNHSANLGLTVQSSVAPAVARTTYMRTDSIAALDQPSNEPHHRHLVYDAANHHIFVANTAANRVEVLSSQDASRTAMVDVAGANSVDLSPDGKAVYVGTLTEQIDAIDTASLQRTRIWPVVGIASSPNTLFDRPEEVIALTGGRALVRLRLADGPAALLAMWDPATNSLTDLTATQPQLFQNGVGVIARSGDRSRILVASNDNSGTTAVFDGNGNVVTGSKTLGAGAISFAAANPDGSQFAAIAQNGESELLLLLDSALNIATTRAVTESRGIAFSQDGSQLFVAEAEGGSNVVQVLSATDLHLASQVVDPVIQGTASTIEDADDTGYVFGLNNRGIAFVDTAFTTATAAQPATFSSPPAVSPSSGPNTGATAATLTGQNFGSNPKVRFGSQFAASVTGSSATQIQATTPASAISGAANVFAYFVDGSVGIAPDAFSYGPQILRVLPNAGNSSGGDTVAIYGYGFGEDASKVSVKFGQATGSVQKIEDLAQLASSLGLDSTYPFPLQRITVNSPSGPAGTVNLTVGSTSGTVTAARRFQFLGSDHVYPQVGAFKFISYDQKRNLLYASDIDHLSVFDLESGFFTAPISPPGGVQPNNLFRQSVLTPDASQLAIADFGAQSIYLINPDTGTGTKVFVGGLPGDSNSGPVRLAATSAQTLFVGVAGGIGAPSNCTSCLIQINLADFPITAEAAPQADSSLITSVPLLDANAIGDAAFFAFSAAPGKPLASWSATAPQQFAVTATGRLSSDLTVAADGTRVASRVGSAVEIRDPNLSLWSVTTNSEVESVPQRTDVPGIALHPSGALLYVPFLNGAPPVSPVFAGLQGYVDILDANNGRLRLRVMLPEPFSMTSADSDGLRARFLAIDENGQRLFALTASGLTVVELSEVPLGFGAITPASASAGIATTLTIRGSGFRSGVAATLGGKPASVSFVDMNTLHLTLPTSLNSGPQRLTLTNPSGESISVDAAFNVN